MYGLLIRPILLTIKTASVIGGLKLKAKIFQCLTRSAWSHLDQNQKSLTALLNY